VVETAADLGLDAEDPSDPDGSGPPAVGLASELALLGWDVTVLARRDRPASADSAAHGRAATTVTPGVELHLLDAGPAQPLPDERVFGHMPAFAHQLRRRWLTSPPDVVHALSWTTGWAALSAGIGAPLVQTLTGLGGAGRRRQRQRGTAVEPFERRQIESRLLADAAHVIVPCAGDAAAIETAGGPEIVDRLSVVGPGIDPALFVPSGPRTGPGTVAAPPSTTQRLLVHGRLVPRAGVDIAIRALVQLPTAELVVAGGPAAARLDDDREVRRLRALAQRCAVADRVTFVGEVPRAGVPALIRSADVVVCVPWHSRMGITPIEALACGRPVVASTVDGVPDVLVPGRTGILVPPRSPEALVEAVERLLANPTLRVRMGEEGVARVRQHHTWAQVARSTREVYRMVTTPSRERVPA
jgi:glycosyltransferase involved in cell wall biosynthesis